MAKITSVKTSSDNNKLFTAQINDDNSREFKEYDITSGINNKSLNNTADVTGFDEGMDVITVNPSGDKFVGVDRRGRDVVNLSSTNNFSINTFNLLSSFKVDRLVRGDVYEVVPAGFSRGANVIYSGNSHMNSFRKIINIGGDEFLIIGEYNNVYGLYKLDHEGNLNGPIQFTFEVLNINNISIDPNNKFIFMGNFTIDGFEYHLIRLNNDFSIDESFNKVVTENNIPNVCKFLPNGNIIIGGSYTSINGDSTYRCATLLDNDGNIIPSFIYSMIGTVYDILVLDDGRFLIGGSTRFFNNQYKNLRAFNIDGSEITFSNFYQTNTNIIMKLYSTGDRILVGKYTSIDIFDYNLERLYSNVISNSGVIYDMLMINQDQIMIAGVLSPIVGGMFTPLKIINTNGEENIHFPNIKIDRQIWSLTLNSKGDVIMVGPVSSSLIIDNISINNIRGIIKYTLGGVSLVTQTEIPFVTMSTNLTRFIKVTTNISTPASDFTSITISDGINTITITPDQVNTEINANSLIGRNLTVTYDLTGNKDINTVLSEYNLTINK